MMNGQTLQNVAWGLTTLTEVLLLASLAYKKLLRVFPVFSLYILAAILQSATMAVVYYKAGFLSAVAFQIGWGSQGIVTLLRWLAVAEIARRVLSAYGGIWRLAKWVLTVLSVLTAAVSLLLWKDSYFQFVGYAERGVQLAIAAVIVALFLFARYYQVKVPRLERMLAIGLFLYSCFSVVNYSVLETELRAYGYIWNFLDIVTFFATLLIWMGAVWKPREELAVGFVPAQSEGSISAGEYEALTGQLSGRLKALNERLSRIRQAAGPR